MAIHKNIPYVFKNNRRRANEIGAASNSAADASKRPFSLKFWRGSASVAQW